jgi:hypothetical protein
MKLLIVLASLVATTAAAHADPTGYVETDVMLGGASPVIGPNMLGSVAGGRQLAPGVWAHGQLTAGPAADDQGSGKNLQARAGVEGHACVQSAILCGVMGADLGVQHGTWTRQDGMESEQLTALVIVPHVGLDVGGRNLRARLGLELDEALLGRHQTSYAPTTDVSGTIGVELAAGVAYQW